MKIRTLSCVLLAASGALVLNFAAVAGTPTCGEWVIAPTPVPEGSLHSRLYDVHAVAANNVWAVGEYVRVTNGDFHTFALVMHWDGSAWTIVDVPQPTECEVCHENSLRAVHASGPNDVWVAGMQDKSAPPWGFNGIHMLVMHWDGATWEVMEDVPVQSGASGDFIRDVIAFAPDDVWFFGENLYEPFPLQIDLVIALRWDGNFAFSDVPIVNFESGGFGDGNSFHAASALAPDDIWAVGAAGDGDSMPCDLSQIHHWDGEAWTHVPADLDGQCLWHDLNAVVAIAPDDVWAGGDLFDGNGYEPLVLHWDGKAWNKVDAPLGVFDFVAFASDDIYAFGNGVMHWDGTAWTVVENFPGVSNLTILGASGVGPCEIWAVGRQLGAPEFVPFAAHLVPGERMLGDIVPPDGDGVVDENDRAMLCVALGSSMGDAEYMLYADLNEDGVIDEVDQQMFNEILPPCAGDIVTSATFEPPADGVTDGADLAYLLGAWASEPSCADMVTSESFAPPPDGIVDGADLAYLLGAWGGCE